MFVIEPGGVEGSGAGAQPELSRLTGDVQMSVKACKDVVGI